MPLLDEAWTEISIQQDLEIARLRAEIAELTRRLIRVGAVLANTEQNIEDTRKISKRVIGRSPTSQTMMAIATRLGLDT